MTETLAATSPVMQGERPLRDIAVCVITRCRPDALQKTLTGIATQEVDRSITVRILVVDNDPACSARLATAEVSRRAPHVAVEYSEESRVGIPFARNRALQLASAADAIVFVDDDEVPSPGWLRALLDAQARFQADAVFGPVIPKYPEHAPEWIVKAKFFERKRFRTGDMQRIGATNNVLIRAGALTGTKAAFNIECANTGGDDSQFFHRFYKAGKRMVWCDEAVVTESVALSRMTLTWLIKHGYRGGTTWIVAIRPFESFLVALRWIAHGFAKAVIGLLAALAFLPFGRARSVRALQWLASGIGMLVSLTGIQYQAYKHVHVP